MIARNFRIACYVVIFCALASLMPNAMRALGLPGWLAILPGFVLGIAGGHLIFWLEFRRPHFEIPGIAKGPALHLGLGNSGIIGGIVTPQDGELPSVPTLTFIEGDKAVTVFFHDLESLDDMTKALHKMIDALPKNAD